MATGQRTEWIWRLGCLRDLLNYYDLEEKHSILHDGVVELIVNCMTDVEPDFIEWEMY